MLCERVAVPSSTLSVPEEADEYSTWELDASLVVHVTVAPVAVIPVTDTFEITGAVRSTVMPTEALRVLLLVSVALAVIVWGPVESPAVSRL